MSKATFQLKLPITINHDKTNTFNSIILYYYLYKFYYLFISRFKFFHITLKWNATRSYGDSTPPWLRQGPHWRSTAWHRPPSNQGGTHRLLCCIEQVPIHPLARQSSRLGDAPILHAHHWWLHFTWRAQHQHLLQVLQSLDWCQQVPV